MFGLNYHPDKANVIANALSGKSLHVSGMMVKEAKLIKSFRDLNLRLNHVKVTSDIKGSLELKRMTWIFKRPLNRYKM